MRLNLGKIERKLKLFAKTVAKKHNTFLKELSFVLIRALTNFEEKKKAIQSCLLDKKAQKHVKTVDASFWLQCPMQSIARQDAGKGCIGKQNDKIPQKFITTYEDRYIIKEIIWAT